MASAKLSVLVSVGTSQTPTDLYYIDDVSAGAAGSKSITGNSLFSFPTRNITDGALRFGAFAAPALSGAAEAAIYFDSGTNRLLFSENAGAYVRVGNVTGPAAATDEALARFDLATGRLLQNSAITLSDAGALSFPDDIRQVFNPGANVAGLNVGALAGDPGTPVNGDIWYDSAGNLLRARINGASVTLNTGDVVGPAGATDNAIARFDGATGKLIQNSVVTISDLGAFTFPDGVRQTFNPDATVPGLNVGSQAGDPSTPINGDIWYDSTGNLLRARINGASVSLGAGGGGTPGGADTQIQYNNAGSFGGVTGFTSDGTNVTAGSGNLRATSPRITTSIFDTNGLTILLLTAAATAVNSIAIANSATGNSPELGVTGADTDLNLILSAKGAGFLTSAFPLTLSSSTTTSFTTPTGALIPTKINVPLFDPGNFAQIVAMGIDNINANRRVLSLFDARNGNHQPTLAIFSPDENQICGVSWNGSNNEVTIVNTATTSITRLNNGTVGSIVVIGAPGLSPQGWLSVQSGSASSIALQVDSAATPTVDIARFTINALTTAGLYAGVSSGAFYFDAGERRVTTQFDKTNDTTLATVTGLSVTVESGKTYRFEAVLYTTSNVAGGVQFAISSSGATTIIYEAIVFSASAVVAQTRATTAGTAVGAITAVTAAYCRITGSIVTSAAGSLAVQFAQNVSNGTASSVLVGSTFTVSQIV